MKSGKKYNVNYVHNIAIHKKISHYIAFRCFFLAIFTSTKYIYFQQWSDLHITGIVLIVITKKKDYWKLDKICSQSVLVSVDGVFMSVKWSGTEVFKFRTPLLLAKQNITNKSTYCWIVNSVTVYRHDSLSMDIFSLTYNVIIVMFSTKTRSKTTKYVKQLVKFVI